MSAKTFAQKAKGLAGPVIGFGVGWLAFSLAEDGGWVSAETQRKITIANLKLQLSVQSALPASVVEKYGFPTETLQGMIAQLEKGYAEHEVNDRVTFDTILSECEVPEQIGYLEEHASEDIPYFYIADVFHSWARLHRSAFARTDSVTADAAEESSSRVGAAASSRRAGLRRDDKDFDSAILCDALWNKMLNKSVPFDVSVRALCVLAVSHKANAKRLAQRKDGNVIVELYDAYKTSNATESTKDNVVDEAEVYAATLLLLSIMNDLSVHKRWLPWVGPPSTGPYPLASQTNGDQWCRLFTPSQATVREKAVVSETAALFAELMAEKLQCVDRGASATLA